MGWQSSFKKVLITSVTNGPEVSLIIHIDKEETDTLNRIAKKGASTYIYNAENGSMIATETLASKNLYETTSPSAV